jgi:hypothetical protein
MLRPAFLFVLVFALQGIQAQAVQSSGAGASILSPSSPGTGHGVPSSVNSVAGQRQVFARRQSFPVIFGTPRSHRRPRPGPFVPVPIFIPAYPLVGDSAYAPADQAAVDQSDQQPSANADADNSGPDNDALRQAYYQGAHDALAAAQQHADSRYGEHYFDSREKGQAGPSGADQQKAESDDNAGANNGPATVFVFKDGHKIETQNYAIQGQTLFDFSNNHLTKVKLTELDLDATKKANDELGITVKLPPSTP